jgi:mono/diheme cytochrome c family protein
MTYMKVICLTFLIGLAAVTEAQQTSIHLPPDNAMSHLKAGAGQEVVLKNCIVCHSTDYIVTQPRSDETAWAAEVHKMINVFGARISDSDAKAIADYLASAYGPSTSSSRPVGASH